MVRILSVYSNFIILLLNLDNIYAIKNNPIFRFTISANITIFTTPKFGPRPVSTICPSCRQNIVTQTITSTSTKQVLVGLLLAIAG